MSVVAKPETRGATGPEWSTPTTPQHRSAAVQTRATTNVSFTRLLRVELFKMFNTRAGFWLVASVVMLSAVATIGVLVFGSEQAMTYASFSTAVGLPIAVIIPVMAILTVTSEYGQRTALTTFTLVPQRGRVIGAKLAVSVLVGAVGIIIACAVAALGNLVGAALHDITPVWETSALDLSMIVVANVLNMLVGFTLGVVMRNSAAAVVGYFVYSFIFPNIMGALAFYREGFMDVWPWVDLFYTTTALYEGAPVGIEWAQLAVTACIWLALPMTFGLWRTLRAEVK